MAKDVNKETTIRNLYTELNKFNLNGDYDKALKSANRSNFHNLGFFK